VFVCLFVCVCVCVCACPRAYARVELISHLACLLGLQAFDTFSRAATMDVDYMNNVLLRPTGAKRLRFVQAPWEVGRLGCVLPLCYL
jgi:hypothetical protein